MTNKGYLKFFRIFGIALFIYILSRVDWPQFFSILKNISVGYFSLSVVLIAPIILLLILKWKVLVDSLEVKIPLGELSRMFIKGLFLGLITPGKLGEFYRAKYLADATGTSLALGLYTVVSDRLVGLTARIFIGSLGAILLFFIFKIDNLWPLGVVILIVIFALYFVVKKKYAKATFKALIRFLLPKSLKEKAEVFFENFCQGARKLNKFLVARLFLLEFIAYTMGVLACYLIALSLGISIPFWYLFLINALVALMVSLPISVFGLGTREAGFIFFLSFLGISISAAVLYSLLVLVWHLFRMIPGLIIFLKETK